MRGSEARDVPVRSHLLAGLGLLVGVAALATLRVPLGLPLPEGDLRLGGLVGATLVLQGIAYWYLPSFAKRAVTPYLAARTAPWVGLLAGVVPLARLVPPGWLPASMALALDVVLVGAAALLAASFAGVLVVSVLAGPPWRGGVPFWRKEGPFRAGDRAALAASASGAAWLALAAVLLVLAPRHHHLAWGAGLGLLVLGGLAHLLPRARGSPLPAGPFLAGVLLLDAGLALLAAGVTLGAPVAAAGTLATAAALGRAVDGRGKPAGPRLRQARPLLLAAWLLLVPAGLLLALRALRPEAALAALAEATAGLAILLGLMGLSLLTLPVLANQRPDPRHLAPAAGAGVLTGLLLAAGVPLPPLAPLVPATLLLTVALWVAVLAPLRRPRRACPTPAA